MPSALGMLQARLHGRQQRRDDLLAGECGQHRQRRADVDVIWALQVLLQVGITRLGLARGEPRRRHSARQRAGRAYAQNRLDQQDGELVVLVQEERHGQVAWVCVATMGRAGWYCQRLGELL